MTDRTDWEALFHSALHNAIYWQNRCCDQEEIIEVFCMDAEDQQKALECMKYPGEQHERFALV